MASDYAIKVEHLGKTYRIRHEMNQPYVALRDVLTDRVSQTGRALTDRLLGRAAVSEPRSIVHDFWALQDLTFEIQRGTRVGIIGRNGAGKSTLLKVLSRITAPSTGIMRIRGRVASLLEIGTGFHPELTGRENIYLNGAVLGMSYAEIKARFDAIVAFAEVEQFLDTPVKRYSSGMGVRLGFAIAAHVEPEILIVDEVLAVGDAAFQRKCLNKMEDVGQEGRTVLFVSHSMSAITRLCDRAILLEEGRIVADGESHRVAAQYLGAGTGSSAIREWPHLLRAPGDAVARLQRVAVCGSDGVPRDAIDIRDEVLVEVDYWCLQAGKHLTTIIHLYNSDDVCLFSSGDYTNASWWNTPVESGLVRSRCRIPGNFLAEGRITVFVAVVSLSANAAHAAERHVVSFEVVDRSEGDGARGSRGGKVPGVVRPLLDWSVQVDAGARPPE